jgi:hypothetical protein
VTMLFFYFLGFDFFFFNKFGDNALIICDHATLIISVIK